MLHCHWLGLAWISNFLFQPLYFTRTKWMGKFSFLYIAVLEDTTILENKNSYKLLQTPLYIVPHCHIIPYNPLLLLLLTYNPSSWFAVFHLILWSISISYFVVQSKRRSFLGIPSHMINFTGKNSRFA